MAVKSMPQNLVKWPETAIFDDRNEGKSVRIEVYLTRQEAVNGHRRWVHRVKKDPEEMRKRIADAHKFDY